MGESPQGVVDRHDRATGNAEDNVESLPRHGLQQHLPTVQPAASFIGAESSRAQKA
jgi:hypothetical protein